MKKFHYIILTTFFLCFLSCTELDVTPLNVVQDKDLFTNPEGITSYMARIYSKMPIEDFKYSPTTGFNNANFYGHLSAITGEAISRDQTSISETFQYWGYAYTLIRECNYFEETLPKYASNFSEAQVKNWLGEARFIRATAYFSLAKRFGGVPLVDKVLAQDVKLEDIAANIDALQIPRASEAATWDFIGADLDYAFENLPETNQLGRATKYAAAGFKSRAMVYAACIAKYNTISLTSGGQQIVGIPATEASKYFQKSYEAALLLNGKFALYKNAWVAGNTKAQYENYVNMFFDASSKENILVKLYRVPEAVHGYDANNLPRQLAGASNVASETCPTLNLVELYDGLPKNADGTIAILDAQGKYKLYSKTMDLFANAEPRLRATIILPGDELKGESIDMRRGIYKGSTAGGISKLLPNGSTAVYPTNLIVSSGAIPQTAYTLPDGSKINPAGESGGFTNRNIGGTVSGFSVRKYINPNMPRANVSTTTCEQTWIELRYAEVLLNRAEAAYELFTMGMGANYQQDAFDIINSIRERAGATLLISVSELNLQVIRNERKKELAFENKTYWDLRRWRVYTLEQTSTLYRTLWPMYSAGDGKYFFDDRLDERNSRYTWDTRWYYNQIPQVTINKSPNLVQNPGY